MLVSIAGPEVAERIMREMGGEAIYVPKRRLASRDRQIKHEFRDMLSCGSTAMSSYRQLARKHDLTTRRVMAIVNH